MPIEDMYSILLAAGPEEHKTNGVKKRVIWKQIRQKHYKETSSKPRPSDDIVRTNSESWKKFPLLIGPKWRQHI